jgi:hypothetical protein
LSLRREFDCRGTLLTARTDGLHDALKVVEAKLAAAEQGRANAVAVAERTKVQLAEAGQRAREHEQRASDVEHRQPTPRTAAGSL